MSFSVPPEILPSGWKMLNIRHGSTFTRTMYLSPEGKRFSSLISAKQFLWKKMKKTNGRYSQIFNYGIPRRIPKKKRLLEDSEDTTPFKKPRLDNLVVEECVEAKPKQSPCRNCRRYRRSSVCLCSKAKQPQSSDEEGDERSDVASVRPFASDNENHDTNNNKDKDSNTKTSSEEATEVEAVAKSRTTPGKRETSDDSDGSDSDLSSSDDGSSDEAVTGSGAKVPTPPKKAACSEGGFGTDIEDGGGKKDKDDGLGLTPEAVKKRKLLAIKSPFRNLLKRTLVRNACGAAKKLKLFNKRDINLFKRPELPI